MWLNKFIIINYKNNILLSTFVIISGIIGILCSLISFSFYVSCKNIGCKAFTSSFYSTSFTISNKEIKENDSSAIKFEKSIRPTLLQCEELLTDSDSVIFDLNLSYFIKENPYIKYKDREISCTFVPIYNFTNKFIDENLICKQFSNNSKGVYLNIDAYNMLNNLDENSMLSIKYDFDFSIDHNNEVITEDFFFEDSFMINGVIQDFSFMSYPTIYYSYDYFCNVLKEYILEDYSSKLQKEINIYDYVLSVDNECDHSSYSICGFSNISYLEQLYEKTNDTQDSLLKIDSPAYENAVAYENLFNAISVTIIIYSLLSFASVLLIFSIMSFYSFMKNKRQSAILSCVGASNIQILMLYIFENIINILITIIISLICFLPIQNLLNIMLYRNFNIQNILELSLKNYGNFIYSLPFYLSIICIFIIIIFTSVPILIYKTNYISEELREE